jgi:hypothetical protein
MSIDGLGRAMTRHDVARELGVSLDAIRANPAMFGGVKVSPNRTVFFEKLIARNMEALNAAQAQKSEGSNRMVWQDQAAIGQNAGEEIPHQEGGCGMGEDQQDYGSPASESRHGLW